MEEDGNHAHCVRTQSTLDTTVMEHIMECHKLNLNLEQNWTACEEANEDSQRAEHFIFT